jgi:hypothetical protein
MVCLDQKAGSKGEALMPEDVAETLLQEEPGDMMGVR